MRVALYIMIRLICFTQNIPSNHIFTVEDDTCIAKGDVCMTLEKSCCKGLSCEPHPQGYRIDICVPTSSEGNVLMQRVHIQITMN